MCCRFHVDNSPISGFSLWIYAVPTTSNSTRLIISAGLSPKAFAQGAAKTKTPMNAVKTAGIRAFSAAKPRQACSAPSLPVTEFTGAHRVQLQVQLAAVKLDELPKTKIVLNTQVLPMLLAVQDV